MERFFGPIPSEELERRLESLWELCGCPKSSTFEQPDRPSIDGKRCPSIGGFVYSRADRQESMPHDGRHYPFCVEYWATEGWFWPGFVPYKLVGLALPPLNPPWNVLLIGWTGVSDPVQVSTDVKTVSYTFHPTGSMGGLVLVVSLDKIGVLESRQCRWRATIGDGVSWWATAYLMQDYPQYAVAANGFDYSLPSPPYTSDDGPNLQFRPATYAEGGSPYP